MFSAGALYSSYPLTDYSVLLVVLMGALLLSLSIGGFIIWLGGHKLLRFM